MRPRRSNSRPRYAADPSDPLDLFSFRWRRRYWIYIAVFSAFVYWLLPSTPAPPAPHDDGRPKVNWSAFAYSLYATDSTSLCHAVLVFHSLAQMGSKADRVLFYPSKWNTEVHDAKDRDSQLLVMARDTYRVKIEPIKLLRVQAHTKDGWGWSGVWDASVTKFAAFSLTSYERVVALDPEVTLLQSLDDLFLLPPAPIAMPRAYWSEKPGQLSPLLMVIEPSLEEFEDIKRTVFNGGDMETVTNGDSDTLLANERFRETATVLPHRPWVLLSNEFRRKNHSAYLGSEDEPWDADEIYKEAKVVQFSIDWPPWYLWPSEGIAGMQPDCGGSREGTCAERVIWRRLYDDFRERRRNVCRYLSVPAPDWKGIKGGVHGTNANANATEAAAAHAEGEASDAPAERMAEQKGEGGT